MSAHVLLNLLNMLGKGDKCKTLLSNACQAFYFILILEHKRVIL